MTKIDKKNRVCEAPDCDKPCTGVTRFCQPHGYRFYRHGDFDVSKYQRKRREIPGLNDDGYVRIRKGGVQIMEHRDVMERILGRPLLPEENVHHINGVRHDNRPENLELWSSSQPAGQRVTDKLAWAYEIIELYKDVVS